MIVQLMLLEVLLLVLITITGTPFLSPKPSMIPLIISLIHQLELLEQSIQSMSSNLDPLLFKVNSLEFSILKDLQASLPKIGFKIILLSYLATGHLPLEEFPSNIIAILISPMTSLLVHSRLPSEHQELQDFSSSKYTELHHMDAHIPVHG